MKFQKLLGVVSFVSILLALVAVPVFADGFVTVQGDALSISPQDVNFTAVTLDGSDQTTNGTTDSAWVAKDPTGTGAGWHVTISSTDFTSVGGKTISVALMDMQLLDESIVITDGNTKPASSMTSMTTLSDTAQTLASAAVDTGMGAYDLTPTFQLLVPAETYAGAYTATFTVSILSSP